MRLLLILSLLAVGLAGPLHGSRAQEVQRIAAIVNDDVISGYDLERRVELVIRSTRMRDSAETRRRLRAKVLELLIDEKLQLQAAERLNIHVSDADMKAAMRSIESQNNVPTGHFDDIVRRLGIDRDSLLQQIRARIAWTKVLNRKLPQIPEEEIDEEMQKLERNVGKPEYRISEIFIPIKSADRQEEARRSALDLLAQIRGGVPFASAAREFSRGATAESGGQVGWVRADQLAAEISDVLAQLKIGEISEPIRTAGGYYLITLHEKRRFMQTDPSEVKIELRQLAIGLASGASPTETAAAKRRARTLAASVTSGCQNLESLAAANDGVQYVDFGNLKVSQLAAPIRAAVEALPVNRISAPVQLPDSISLFVVCHRDEPQAEQLTRESVTRDLRQKKMMQIAQRYIRDLRRDALVEYR